MYLTLQAPPELAGAFFALFMQFSFPPTPKTGDQVFRGSPPRPKNKDTPPTGHVQPSGDLCIGLGARARRGTAPGPEGWTVSMVFRTLQRVLRREDQERRGENGGSRGGPLGPRGADAGRTTMAQRVTPGILWDIYGEDKRILYIYI